MADLRIDAKHSALLVMDFQTAIVERFAHRQDALLEATAKAFPFSWKMERRCAGWS
jgi:hypothetical protein